MSATATPTTAAPKVMSLEPPKMRGRGRQAIHPPEMIEAIAKAAAKGWTSNGLVYNTQSGAQGALSTVKESIVSQKLAQATKDMAGRVFEMDAQDLAAAGLEPTPDGGRWVFTIKARKS